MRREDQQLVLRRDLDPFRLGRERLGEAVRWRSDVRAAAGSLGWPTPVDVAPASWIEGGWWSLETFLPGTPAHLSPDRHAAVLARWLDTSLEPNDVGPQPHRLRHLDVLADDSIESVLATLDHDDDRRLITHRLDQARSVAATVDWDASPVRIVHGDLASHNILWDGTALTGLIDFELATADRRVVELIHVWRCKYDDVLLAFDAISPLHEHEWRMLLVDWWALLISLAVLHLRRGDQPGRWELEGLRRTTPVARHLERSLVRG